MLAGNSSATPTYSVGREGAASQFQAKNHGVVASETCHYLGPRWHPTSQKNCRLHIVKPQHGHLYQFTQSMDSRNLGNMSFNIYDHSLSRRYPPPGPDSNRLDKIAKAMTIVEFAGENFIIFARVNTETGSHETFPEARPIVLIRERSQPNRFITDLIGLVLADVIKDGAEA